MTGSMKRLMFLLLVLVMFMTGCTDPKTENMLGEELLNKIQLSETFDEKFILDILVTPSTRLAISSLNSSDISFFVAFVHVSW